MGLINWAQKQITRAVYDPKNNNFNEVMYEFINKTAIIPPENRENYLKLGFEGNPIVYAVVNAIAKKAAMGSDLLYEVKDEKALKMYKHYKQIATGIQVKDVRTNQAHKDALSYADDYRVKALQEVEKHKIHDLIDQPNPETTGFEFKYSQLVFQLIVGEAFTYGVDGMDQGLRHYLYGLPAHYTNILGGNKFKPIDGYKVFWSKDEMKFEPEEIWHSKYPGFNYSNPGSHWHGMSPLKPIWKNVIKNNTAVEEQLKQMQNSGVLGFISNKSPKDGPLTSTQMQDVTRQMKSMMSSSKDRDRLRGTNADLVFNQVGLPPADLLIHESNKEDLATVCNAYGWPIQLMNSQEASTDNNMKWAAKNAINNVIAPLLYQYDNGFNKFVVKGYEKKEGRKLYYEHDIMAYPEMQEDMKDTAEWLEKAWWIKPKDKQAVMKFTQDDKDPMMNTYLIPNNLLPAEDLAAADEPIEADDY